MSGNILWWVGFDGPRWAVRFNEETAAHIREFGDRNYYLIEVAM